MNEFLHYSFVVKFEQSKKVEVAQACKEMWFWRSDNYTLVKLVKSCGGATADDLWPFLRYGQLRQKIGGN